MTQIQTPGSIEIGVYMPLEDPEIVSGVWVNLRVYKATVCDIKGLIED